MIVYEGMSEFAGIEVKQPDALAFACEKCGIAPAVNWEEVDPEFAEMMEDWFFSGSWIALDTEKKEEESWFA